MACESCKLFVKDALTKLKLRPTNVTLGEVEIKGNIKEKDKKAFNDIIRTAGLELVETKGGILLEKIRRYVISYLQSEKKPKLNLSDYLSQNLKYDYNYISTFFSEVEAKTITRYYNDLRIEKSKDMMLFHNMTISQIADKLYYSSVPHFSGQFKKHTGIAPSEFKKIKEKRRFTIQDLSAKKNKNS